MENRTVMIPFVIDQEWVDDVICTAFDLGVGGCYYWIYKLQERDGTEKTEYLTEIISRGGSYVITTIDDEGPFVLNLDIFISGYQKYLEWCRTTGREAYSDPCDIDADIADVIVQFALFNDIVYG